MLDQLPLEQGRSGHGHDPRGTQLLRQGALHQERPQDRPRGCETAGLDQDAVEAQRPQEAAPLGEEALQRGQEVPGDGAAEAGGAADGDAAPERELHALKIVGFFLHTGTWLFMM